MPSAAAATRATRPAGTGTYGLHASAAAIAVVSPLALRIHEPTLIGEVTLNSRSMLRNRDDLPRSEISRSGLVPTPASAHAQARRASSSLPRRPATSASPADAPPRPPVKK